MTYSIAKLLGFFSVMAFTSAIHLEYSTAFLRNALNQESDYLNGLISSEWAALGHQGAAPKLRYESLNHRNAADGAKNSVEFVFPGETSDGKTFEAVFKFATAPGDYKDVLDNLLIGTAEISGVADNGAIKETLGNVAAAFADWSHNKLNEAPDMLYLGQTLSYFISRLGGQMKSTDKAVTIDLATKGQLEKAKTEDASTFYAKFKTDTPMYVGGVIADTYLTHLLKEITDLIQKLDVPKVLKQIPDSEKYTKHMTVDKVKQIMPDVGDKYSGSRPISFKFDYSRQADQKEVREFIEKNTKATFKKDAMDATLAFGIQFLAQKENGNWEAFRTGYISLGISAQVSQTSDDGNLYLRLTKVNAGIRKITLIDPTVEDEEERNKEDESGAILGLVNLLVKQQIPKEQNVTIPMNKVPEINPAQVKLNVQPGFESLAYYDFERDFYASLRTAFTPDKNPRSILEPLTKGLENAELKRRGVIPCPDCDIIDRPIKHVWVGREDL